MAHSKSTPQSTLETGCNKWQGELDFWTRAKACKLSHDGANNHKATNPKQACALQFIHVRIPSLRARPISLLRHSVKQVMLPRAHCHKFQSKDASQNRSVCGPLC